MKLHITRGFDGRHFASVIEGDYLYSRFYGDTNSALEARRAAELFVAAKEQFGDVAGLAAAKARCARLAEALRGIVNECDGGTHDAGTLGMMAARAALADYDATKEEGA